MHKVVLSLPVLLLALLLCHSVCSSRMAREANQNDDEDVGPIRGRQTWVRPKQSSQESADSFFKTPNEPPLSKSAPHSTSEYSPASSSGDTHRPVAPSEALFTVQVNTPAPLDESTPEANGHLIHALLLVITSLVVLSASTLQRLWQETDEGKSWVECPHCNQCTLLLANAESSSRYTGLAGSFDPESDLLPEEALGPIVAARREREGQMVVSGSAPPSHDDSDLYEELNQMITSLETIRQDPALSDDRRIEVQEKILYYKERKRKMKHQERHTDYMNEITELKGKKLDDKQQHRFFNFLDTKENRYYCAAQWALFGVWLFITTRRMAPTTTTTLKDVLPWWIPRSLVPNVSHLICLGVVLVIVLLIATVVLAQGNKWALVGVVTLLGLLAVWSMTTLTMATLIYTGVRLFIASLLMALVGTTLFWLVRRAGWVNKERDLRTTLTLHLTGAIFVLLSAAMGYELATTSYPNFRFFALEATLLNMVDKLIQAIDHAR